MEQTIDKAAEPVSQTLTALHDSMSQRTSSPRLSNPRFCCLSVPAFLCLIELPFAINQEIPIFSVTTSPKPR
jgi:hypothetical protein